MKRFSICLTCIFMDCVELPFWVFFQLVSCIVANKLHAEGCEDRKRCQRGYLLAIKPARMFAHLNPIKP